MHCSLSVESSGTATESYGTANETLNKSFLLISLVMVIAEIVSKHTGMGLMVHCVR